MKDFRTSVAASRDAIGGTGSFTWCHFNSDLFSSTYFPRMSPSLNKKESLSSRTTLVPPYSGRRTLSPTFTLTGWISPPFPLEPDPTATTVACNTFPCDFSGSVIPPLVTVSAALLSTSTQSKRGRNFLNACPARIPAATVCSSYSALRPPLKGETTKPHFKRACLPLTLKKSGFLVNVCQSTFSMKKHWFVAFANYCGVNTPTVVNDFKLPMWHLWTLEGGGEWSHGLVENGSSTSLGAQWHLCGLLPLPPPPFSGNYRIYILEYPSHTKQKCPKASVCWIKVKF